MNILFVGNSYTYFNDMPKIFEKLALENGKDAVVDSVTKGGRRLYENLVPEDEYHQRIVGLCSEKQYDVLILQEQSYFALVDYERFLEGLSGLMKLVGAKRTVFYATWGRKEGCPLLDELGLTRAEMGAKLEEAYKKAAETLGAQLSPVGRAFQALCDIAPESELYMPDLSHPSLLGSTLAALVHYQTVFGEAPCVCRSLSLDTVSEKCLLSVITNSIVREVL
ncbi:MAG: hypothetical protein IJW49_01425 [Clostridia bacterium]|nr:hypothetical protein [Clostridia bacterium]